MMYYYPYQYHPIPLVPRYPVFPITQPITRSYPPVDVKIFTHSVKTFRLLMEQGSILLDRLGDAGFATKMMTAAQQGKTIEVERLIKSIGLRVPVVTKYTPSGVNFVLTAPTDQTTTDNCCSLTISMKWGH